MPLPDFSKMTTEQIKSWYGEPKTCTKCRRQLTNAAFEPVKQRGKIYLRSHCRKCMREYYNSKEYLDRKKQRYQESHAVRPGETFIVKKAGEQWRVLGVLEGHRTRPLNLCKTEQEADQAVKQRRIDQIKFAHRKGKT